MLKKGTVVIAKAGKDKGGVFAVIEILDERYVLIADGRHRTLNSPKKKNISHLRRTNVIIDPVTTDRQLRTMLRDFHQEVK